MTETVKAASMEEFQKTPYYQGLGIEGLQSQLGAYEADDAALRNQAEAEYRPAYEQEAEAARQELEREIQGYEAQISGMDTAYDRQRRNTKQAYEESAAQMNNQLTKRGLGRSSLVSAQGAYLQNQRNQALAEIDREQGDAIHAINERIALLTEQAAQSERTRAENYARRLESRVGEMKEKNREASISLQLQIAALQQQGYEAYQDWLLKNRQQEIREKEFEAEYGAELTGGGSGSSAGGGSDQKKQQSSAAAAEEKEKSRGPISQKAGEVVNALKEAAKKLTGSMEGGVKAAAKQTAAKKTTDLAAQMAAARKEAGGPAKKR